jgi:hypothetical protein
LFNTVIARSPDVLQLLRVIALHEQRHRSQIGDILKIPGFPREA